MTYILKRTSFLVLTVGLFLGVTGCSSSTDADFSVPLSLSGAWEQEGLEEVTIQKIKRSPDFLYAATRQGMHRRPLAGSDSPSWEARGLQDETVRDFVVFSDDSLLAGIQLFDTALTDPTLFLTENGGGSWQSYQNNFGGGKQYGYFSAIAKHPIDASILYAKGEVSTVARSKSKGKEWSLIYPDNWSTSGFSFFIKIDKNNPNYIWTGGQSILFNPFLIKSKDAGKSWQHLSVVENAETTVYDVETHPSEPDRVLAGLGGGIRKSSDGGQSWHTVLEDVNIYSLTKSAKDDRIVYAAGEIRSGKPVFWASGDFGDTWQQVTMEDGPSDLFVLDILSILEGGREVLYLGTNKGVYSYTFAE